MRARPGGRIITGLPNGTGLTLLAHYPSERLYAVFYQQQRVYIEAGQLQLPPVEIASDASLRLYRAGPQEEVMGLIERVYGVPASSPAALAYHRVLQQLNPLQRLKWHRPDDRWGDPTAEGVALLDLHPEQPLWLPGPQRALELRDPGQEGLARVALYTTTFLRSGAKAIFDGLRERLQTVLTVPQQLKMVWDKVCGFLTEEDLLDKLGQMVHWLLLEGGWKQLARELWDQFWKQWNDPDPLMAWSHRGRIIGAALVDWLSGLLGGQVQQLGRVFFKALQARFTWLLSWGEGLVERLGETTLHWPPAPLAPKVQTSTGQLVPVQQQRKLNELWKNTPQQFAQEGGEGGLPQNQELLKKASELGNEHSTPPTTPPVVKPASTDPDAGSQTSPSPIISAASDPEPARVRHMIEGLYDYAEGADRDFVFFDQFNVGKLKSSTQFDIPFKKITSSICKKSDDLNDKLGKMMGTFITKYIDSSKEIVFEYSNAGDIPTWTKGHQFDFGNNKGVPSSIYLRLYQLNKLGVKLSSLKKATIYQVINVESITLLERLIRNGVDCNTAILKTPIYQYVESILNQSGHQIKSAKMNPHLAHYYLELDRDGYNHLNLYKKYNLSPKEGIPYKFDIELELDPLPLGQEARKLE